MRNNKLLLQDIIEAGRRILLYTMDMDQETFAANELVKDAVVRNFEIIGEAAGRLTDTFQKQHSSIEWRKIKAFRNLLIHQYFGVDYALVWDIIQKLLPDTLSKLQQIEAMEQ